MHRPPRSGSRVDAIVEALTAHPTVTERVMVIAAHPDDETIGIGAQLCGFADLSIMHVTDGAPRDGHDAARYGFSNTAAYAAARRTELAHALEAGGIHSARTLAFDIPDQQSWRDLAALTRRIADVLVSKAPQAVITHAYEGGHPDHDAAAFAVHAACCLLPDHSAPAIMEMALYHRAPGYLVRGAFSASAPPATVIRLDEDAIARKHRMIDCFTTQRWLLAEFPLGCERLRRAPQYHFREPPHPGMLHYETLGWGISGAEWRRSADAALTELELAHLACL